MRYESRTDFADTEDLVVLTLVNLPKLRMRQYIHGGFTTPEKQQYLLTHEAEKIPRNLKTVHLPQYLIILGPKIVQ